MPSVYVNPPLRIAVVTFPGSLDDRDLVIALERLGAQVKPVWHRDEALPADVEGVALPGGFSYGDYLRPGAMARFSPVMSAIRAFADGGGPVLGVCNGFQILCEAGLLPGALVRNSGLRFICADVELHVADAGPVGAELTGTLRMPIKHGQGAYVADPSRPPIVALRYAGTNPNGSEDAIAGIRNEAGNVFGLMPHPEHAVDPLLGSSDGAMLLNGFLRTCAARRERS